MLGNIMQSKKAMKLAWIIVVVQSLLAGWMYYGVRKQYNELVKSNAATGNAYPIELPTKLDTMMLTMGYEDDDLFGLDNAVAWANMFPPGGGFFYLGDDKRRFTTEMFHSLHCLDAIRQSLLIGQADGHSTHCVNYLRKSILCNADPTVMPYLDEGIGMGITHKCRNWNQQYDFITQNYLEYRNWRYESRNMTMPTM